MTQNKDVFLDVSELELDELLEVLHNSEGEITVWAKGHDFREMYQIILLDTKTKKILLKPKTIDNHLFEIPIYFNFKVADLPYFGTAEIKRDKSTKTLELHISGKVFKAEKRKSFRLMTYDDPDASVIVNDNIYRLFDISTTGLGVYLRNEEQADLFPINEIVSNVEVLFHGKKFQIKKGTILRCAKIQTVESYIDKIKVGIIFNEIDEAVESKLFIEINSAVYSKRKGG